MSCRMFLTFPVGSGLIPDGLDDPEAFWDQRSPTRSGYFKPSRDASGLSPVRGRVTGSVLVGDAKTIGAHRRHGSAASQCPPTLFLAASTSHRDQCGDVGGRRVTRATALPFRPWLARRRGCRGCKWAAFEDWRRFKVGLSTRNNTLDHRRIHAHRSRSAIRIVGPRGFGFRRSNGPTARCAMPRACSSVRDRASVCER